MLKNIFWVRTFIEIFLVFTDFEENSEFRKKTTL